MHILKRILRIKQRTISLIWLKSLSQIISDILTFPILTDEVSFLYCKYGKYLLALIQNVCYIYSFKCKYLIISLTTVSIPSLTIP